MLRGGQRERGRDRGGAPPSWSVAAVFVCAIAACTEHDELVAASPHFRDVGPNVIVIFSDDQGYGDVTAQGYLDDVRTPNIDRLAAEGVLFTDGYVTAPQCSPSRAGLVTSRYQQRFGMDEIRKLPMTLAERTIGDRLLPTGYATGMVGKWHLDPNAHSVEWGSKHGKVPVSGHMPVSRDDRLPYLPYARGFFDFFVGTRSPYWASFDATGTSLEPWGRELSVPGFRVDQQSAAAVAFIERHADHSFFLYLGYSAPHTPLAAPHHYLEPFAGDDDMAVRRRYALAMIAAIDAGVGRILDTLADHGIDDDTLVFFISDNGAPLNLMVDSPIDTDPGGWDGSLNTPAIGEKGMLAEGGIRVPFIARFPGRWPAGRIESTPVSALDVGATALGLAGLDVPDELDGVDLDPFMTGETASPPHEALYWRFWNQAAIRKGRHKLLLVGDEGRFLFDLLDQAQETENLYDQRPGIVAELEADLEAWAATLHDPGLPNGSLNQQEQGWYQRHFGGAW